MEKSNHDLTEALAKMQEELLIEKSKRKMLEDEMYKMRLFLQQRQDGGCGNNSDAAMGPTFLSTTSLGAQSTTQFGGDMNGSLSSKGGVTAAGDPSSFSFPAGGARNFAVEDELRSQVTALTATYTKQLDHCRLQDDMIKKLRDALKQKMARIKELETLIKAQIQANPALLSLVGSSSGE